MGYDYTYDVTDIVDVLVRNIDEFRSSTGATVREAFKLFVPGEVAPFEPGLRVLVKSLAGKRFAARRNKRNGSIRPVTPSVDGPSRERVSQVLIEQLMSHRDYQHALLPPEPDDD